MKTSSHFQSARPLLTVTCRYITAVQNRHDRSLTSGLEDNIQQCGGVANTNILLVIQEYSSMQDTEFRQIRLELICVVMEDCFLMILYSELISVVILYFSSLNKQRFLSTRNDISIEPYWNEKENLCWKSIATLA